MKNETTFNYCLIENNTVILKSIPATENNFIKLNILKNKGIVWKNMTGHLCSSIDLSSINN